MHKHTARLHGALVAALFLVAPGCRAQNPAQPPAPGTTQAATPAMPREFDEFMARPEPAYKWEKMAPLPADNASLTGDDMTDFLLQTLGAGAEVTDLKLTSQEWQGAPWTHRLQIIQPAKATHPDTALLLITFGGGSAQEMAVAKAMANLAGAPSAILYNVPNQPLFGQSEDALIAHTFVKYLETGDASWPLLFPMTKSAVKAMDAIGEYTRQEWKAPVTKFVVTGASKRGWTSWLTAAADKRVAGLIPMVYNNLNLARQMPHQLEVWGAYSRSISDYTEKGLPAAMSTPRGQYLAAMVDPWTYRERFTMPKLIVIAANDSYWPLDALGLYRADLPGRSDVLYVPNAKHSLGGQEMRVLGASNGWFRRLAVGKAVPKLQLDGTQDERTGERRVTLKIEGSEKPGAARLWVARSANSDFRASKWQSMPLSDLQSDGKQTVASAVIPAGSAELPMAAAFAEIDLPMETSIVPLRLSSDVLIWRARSATENHPAAEQPLIEAPLLRQ